MKRLPCLRTVNRRTLFHATVMLSVVVPAIAQAGGSGGRGSAPVTALIRRSFLAGRALADEIIRGQVLGGGAPIVKSTVTLYAATGDAPKQLAQAMTDDEGRFEVRTTGAPAEVSLYFLAFGGEPKARGGGNNPAIALLTVLGGKPPAHVVINEMTTVASVWTNAQFLV